MNEKLFHWIIMKKHVQQNAFHQIYIYIYITTHKRVNFESFFPITTVVEMNFLLGYSYWQFINIKAKKCLYSLPTGSCLTLLDFFRTYYPFFATKVSYKFQSITLFNTKYLQWNILSLNFNLNCLFYLLFFCYLYKPIIFD